MSTTQVREKPIITAGRSSAFLFPMLFHKERRWSTAAARLGISIDDYLAALNRGEKICGGCLKSLPRTPRYFGSAAKCWDGMMPKCRDCVSGVKKVHYHKNRASLREQQAIYLRENRSRVYAYNRRWGTVRRSLLRAEMIAAYGGRCACCGEATPQFLQLDHVFNDGADERRLENATGVAFFARLKRRGWPQDRYRLLCANCNFGKQMNGGRCPHEDCH